MADRERCRRIAEFLADHYGRRTWRKGKDPLDELIGTVLSQSTTDINTARAFASLKAGFPDWREAAEAPVEEVEAAIRSGGLARTKAPRIQSILKEVHRRSGGFTLDAVRSMSVPEARAWLESLPGVGPKTASCVLLFSLGRPALPIDTHVHRVTRRIGLIDGRTSAEAAQARLEVALDGNRDEVYSFHLNLIAHGRAICVARSPKCERCFLRDDCDHGRATSHASTR